jgi:hypothetical protein
MLCSATPDVGGRSADNLRPPPGSVWKRSRRVWLGNQTSDHPVNRSLFKPSRALLVKIKRDLENHVRGLLKNLCLVIGRAKFNVLS